LRSLGRANIYCQAQGAQGTKAVKTIADFAGLWSGSYNVDGCSATGEIASLVAFCSNFPNGRTLPHNFNFTADTNGSVSGSVFFGQLQGQVQGTLDATNEVMLTGQVRSGGTTIDTAIRLRSDTAGRISGSLTQRWTQSGLLGTGNLSGLFRDCNRSSSPAITPMVRGSSDLTLELIIQMLGIRR
jgi:hypothetical protein